MCSSHRWAGRRSAECAYPVRDGAVSIASTRPMVELPVTSGLSRGQAQTRPEQEERGEQSSFCGGPRPGTHQHPGCQGAAHHLACAQLISELPVGVRARPSASGRPETEPEAGHGLPWADPRAGSQEPDGLWAWPSSPGESSPRPRAPVTSEPIRGPVRTGLQGASPCCLPRPNPEWKLGRH